ncbi:MAG: hypothetical protein LLF76_12170 [Planctomycetaceae bacterium]|nr:hypothetical protein [Planctomycetaceae bacterium]
MTPKERILAVYQNQTPDQVPFMLDLSHWFYHKNRMPWDLSKSYDLPEYDLITYHQKMGVGFYLPNLGSFYEVYYPEDTLVRTQKGLDGKSITWKIETPLGVISRTRVWNEITYSWAIESWGIKTNEQLKILCYVLENRSYKFVPDKYQAWST